MLTNIFRRLKFNSIQSRLTFWFLFIALVPLSFLIITTYFQRVEAAKQTSIDKISTIRDLKVDLLNNYIKEIKGDLTEMSGDFELRSLTDAIESNDASLENIEKKTIAEELLKRNKKVSNKYSDLYIFNKKTGLVDISTNANLIGTDESNNSLYTNPLASGKISI